MEHNEKSFVESFKAIFEDQLLDLSDPQIEKLLKLLWVYRGTGDVEKFDEAIDRIIVVVRENGLTHHNVALEIQEVTTETGIKRGLFKDLLLLKFGDQLTPTETLSLNNYVRENRSIAMTLEELNSKKSKYVKKILCYARLDELFRGKEADQQYIYQFLFRKYYSIAELKIFLREEGLKINKRMFERFCRGHYLKYGWIVLQEESASQIKIRLTPINWDGLDVPAEGVDFETYKKHK